MSAAARPLPRLARGSLLRACFAAFALALAALSAASAARAEIVFPPGAVVVDVTQPPFLADPSGVADSTAAIQLAIHRASQDGVAGDGIADDGVDDGFQDGFARSRPRVIYFPTGVYRLTDSLVGPALNNAQAGGLIIFQGQSRTGSILRLDASAPGFDNPAAPKPVFTNFTGNSTNNAFMNGVENLTIEVGAGNPGAIALQFGNNNTGHVRHLTLRSLDPARAGAAGLHLSPGTSATNPSGIGLVQHVLIEGFAVGIDTTRGLQMPWVLDHVTLAHQTAVGIANANRPLSINALASTNSVPALRSTGASGHVVMVNSNLSGGAPDQPAIDLQAGHGFFRDIARSGYSTTLRVAGADQAADLAADEFVAGPVLKLWETTPSRSLGLPIADAPEIPWDAPADWHLVPAPTGVAATDTAALQAALSSGKASILLRPGAYAINTTLVIGPAVRRLLGNWATLRVDSAIKTQNVPLLRLAASDHPAVVIEKLQGQWGDATAYLLHHESAADLVLRDIFWVAGPVYRNTPGAGGRLFLENIHSLGGGQTPRENRPAFVFDHQQVWARQINPEMQHPHMINDGGRLWILGFKTGEQRGPVVITRNGGSTEILGGLQNQTYDFAPPDADATALLEIHNANVSAVFLERFESVGNTGALGWGNNAFVARETRGGETRTLRPAVVHRASGQTAHPSPVPVRAGQLGSVVPLFVAYQAGSTIAPLTPRLREDFPATPAFVVSRDTPATAQPLTLFYTVSGSAVAGLDYVALPGSVTIPAGQSSADIVLDPLPRDTLQPARSVTLTLSPNPGYTLGDGVSATVELVAATLVSPGAADADLPPGAAASIQITVFNPEPAPASYTLSGLAGVHTVAHRDSQPGDTVALPAGKTELFAAKPVDDALVTVTLPFAFPFYGSDYASLRVSSNGFVTFDTATTTSHFANAPLPNVSGAARAKIAAYWDDLYLDSASRVWHRALDTDADGTPDAWVLEFEEVTTYATRFNTIPERLGFQLWLFRDGAIRVAYTQSTITAVSYTIGIQDWDRARAVQLVHSGSAPSSVPASPLPPPYAAQAGTTVTFLPPATWAAPSVNTLLVPAQGQATFAVQFQTAGLSPGDYREATLELRSADLALALPVSLLVTPSTPPPPLLLEPWSFSLLSGAAASWYRGRTGSSPASSLAVSGAEVTFAAGGANSATDTHAPLWTHFPVVTLADGETLRLRGSFRLPGALPSVGQGFSFGLVNTGATRLFTDVAGNNPQERRDDSGHGFTFGLGGNTTSRYITKPAAHANNGPWGNIDNSANTLALGANIPLTVADAAARAFVFELQREGSALRVRFTLDDVLLDSGRVVAAPETFTFDGVALVLRREATSVVFTDLVVEHVALLPPASVWRLTHFGVAEPAPDADPDGDGLPNLLEYALGTDPRSSGSLHLPATSLTPSLPHSLQLTFLRARAELTYQVLASSDLASWSVIATNPGQVGESVTVIDPVSAAPRRFLRLRVSQ
jgi:hypothetical protein